jgi:hypothetical protein
MRALEMDPAATLAGAGLHRLVNFYIDWLHLLVTKLRKKMADCGNVLHVTSG